MRELRHLVELDQQPSPTAAGVFTRLGLVHRASLGDHSVQATNKGREVVREYVHRTGDGPEDLKEKLRF